MRLRVIASPSCGARYLLDDRVPSETAELSFSRVSALQSSKMPLGSNVAPSLARSLARYPARSLRPLHSNAAYAISISASPERAVDAMDGIEKKVSPALKVSAARPGLRTKC